MKILVVEDEIISREYLSKIVAKHGLCDVAEDGEIAVNKIKAAFQNGDRYDIVFLDIMLPKLTGHGVLQMIRAFEEDYNAEKKTKVIITSALKDVDNVKKAFNSLADGYIVKPIFREKIEDVFKEYENGIS